MTITPAKSVVEPTLPPRRGVAQNGRNKTAINLLVSNTQGQLVDGANVTLTVERASTRFGGHNHDAATVSASNRPVGTVSSPIGQGQGVYTSTYTASEFAAEDKIRAKLNYLGCNADVVSSTISSQVFPLSFLAVPPPHEAIGGTNKHFGPNRKGFTTSPDNNHWVTLKTNNTMSYLMNLYSIKYGAGLYVNDASLPFGGKFDVNGSWSGSHGLHRRGIDLDIRLYDTANTATNETVEENINLLLQEEKSLEKTLFGEVHGSGTNRHWHIYFW
ncbi:MAG TPA: hypothetical protein EYP39_09175 [Ghiorsea sp.]|nr:hypothetical protein [Ghiorsea sp.]